MAKTVLITGANSGIGLEFARTYAEMGWDVIATHRRDTTLLSDAGTLDRLERELAQDNFENHFLRWPGRIENRMTIEDPVAFSGPWQLTLSYRRVIGLDRIVNYDCDENERNPVVDGKVTIAPRPR